MNYSATSPVFAPSRITAAAFGAFLRRKGSPALIEASAINAALVAAGVDPAVALGQFGAESTFGRAGHARVTRNWGNIAMATPGTGQKIPTAIARAAFRRAVIAGHWSRRFGAKPYSPGNGYTYASFPTWRQGALAYGHLLAKIYRPRGWAPSIQAMCRKWLGGIGVKYVANIVRIANAASGIIVAPPPPVTPPVVPPPPAPAAVPAISVTPEHVEARMWIPPASWFWTAQWQGERWVAEAANPSATYILVHGGPVDPLNLAGMDSLAGRLASMGARGVAVRYPTLPPLTWADALAPLSAALSAYPGAVVVGHSLGGYFASLLAYATAERDHPPVKRLVLLAADDQVMPEYRILLGNAPDARDLMATSKVPVTVIAGSDDPVCTVAELQAVVDDLHTTSHPGRWLVIDGADHDSILGDATAIAAILGG